MIGTFALLYFGGFTLNTMTFGGLALGIGMIVDAAIVVLENTHRHLHMGKDRMTAAIDGSEEVWTAILAATLTHIAVFIPLLFLSGISSILFGQLSFVVMFSLAMSLFVAVTIVPVLCSRWLHTPDEEAARTGVIGRLFRASEPFLEGVDEGYRKALHFSLAHRPTVIVGALASVVAAVMLYPLLSTELLPQTDEGEVNVNAELPVGTRVERTEEAMLRLEEMVKQYVPEATTIITSGGGVRRRLRRRRQQQPRPDQHPPGAARGARAHQRRDRAGTAAPARRAAGRHRPRQSRAAATSSCSGCSAAATATRASPWKSAAKTSTTHGGLRRKPAP